MGEGENNINSKGLLNKSLFGMGKVYKKNCIVSVDISVEIKLTIIPTSIQKKKKVGPEKVYPSSSTTTSSLGNDAFAHCLKLQSLN